MSKYEKYSWFATAEEQQKEEKYVKIANERIAKLQKCGVMDFEADATVEKQESQGSLF